MHRRRIRFTTPCSPAKLLVVRVESAVDAQPVNVTIDLRSEPKAAVERIVAGLVSSQILSDHVI